MARRDLTIADRPAIDAALAGELAAPSEYLFANLYLFRHKHRYALVSEPFLHISGLTYDGESHALPLGAPDEIAVDALLRNGIECLYPLSEEGARALSSPLFRPTFDAADSDYLFDAERLAGLSGAKVRRAQARTFEQAHAPVFDRWDGPSAATVLAGWRADVARSSDRTDVAECSEAIALADALGLEGHVVRTGDGEPVAFLLASRRADGERVIHFAKGRRAFDGCYPWMFSRFARGVGVGQINFEQDLGNPGLAQSKRAYAPVALRHKFRLSRAG